MKFEDPALLDQRISKLSEFTRKTGAMRVWVFCLTLAIGFAFERYGVPRAPAIIVVLGLGLFGFLVYFHGRIDRTLNRFRLRLKLARQQIAVSGHDWTHVPELPKWEGLAAPGRHLADLDFVAGQSVIRLINRTISRAGYEKLLQRFDNGGNSKETILSRQRLVKELRALRVLRKRFLVIAAESASAIDSRVLLELLGNRLTFKGAELPLFLIWALQLAGQILFGFSLFAGWPRYYLIPGVAVLVLYPWAVKKISIFTAYNYALSIEGGLNKLAALIDTLERLARQKKPTVKALLEPFTREKNLKPLAKRTATIMGALGARQNYLVHLGVQFLLPWDLFFTWRLERVRRELELILPGWLEALAELEVAISLAEFAEANSSYTWPIIDEREAFLAARKLGHPLIPSATRIGNDVEIHRDQRCLLITGSNMAGKSTFLRSVGVNVLLANAGSVVCADELHLRSGFGLQTSLRLSDSLEEGLSSFYAEVRQLTKILEQSRAERPAFYLIDEIFRGTNNRERLIGSQAYIQALAQTPAAGLITTHDLELAQLETMNPAIKNFHFEEDIEDDRMVFHYRLAAGPSQSTNALRVMKLAGLPVP